MKAVHQSVERVLSSRKLTFWWIQLLVNDVRRIAPLVASIICFSVPALCSAHFVEFKSPGPGMHFSVGQPVIVFADLFDDSNNHGMILCPSGQTPVAPEGGGPATCPDGSSPVGWPKLSVFVDGVAQVDSVTQSAVVPGTTNFDANGNPDPINFNRFSIVGLAQGTHQIFVRGLFAPPPDSDGSIVDSAPMQIAIDPIPAGKDALVLGADITGNVDWKGLVVVGNGHRVRASGTVTIKDCLVTGLGSSTLEGISGTATSLDIQNTTFESTGAVSLTVSNSASVINNEFRSNNLLEFVGWNPDVPTILTLSGRTAATKLFQGNRIAAGRVVFDDTSQWLIGGDVDAASNILIGPRCTLNLSGGSSNITIRGNYDRHSYRGGWSQGYNLVGSGAGSDILVEHNVIRGSSWDVQDVVGEFRYNLIYGYGHTWIRSGADNASIHHNLFAPEQGGGELEQGIWFYSGEKDIRIDNNTFDGGGNAVTENVAIGNFPFAGPVIEVNNDSHVASLRNNLFTFTRDQENGPGSPHVVGDIGTFGVVDYNAFYSPDNSTHDNYEIVGVAEGVTTGFAVHDMSGSGAAGITDAQLLTAPFAGARVFPYASVVDEADVWNRRQSISRILAAFRARYTPATGSPIIDAGDPANTDARGRRPDIGAIDANGHDLDLFGKFPFVEEIFADDFETKPLNRIE